MSELEKQEFTWPVRVYYEDTDAGSVVYHARYLYFLERARTEWLRSKGYMQSQLIENHSCMFVVAEMQLKFIQAARLDDELEIKTQVGDISRVKMVFNQSVERKNTDETLFRGDSTVVCVHSETMKPNRMPKQILENIL
ncbi:MAG: tol-pal system-associated acyl-CoA thioesterase [bacterium]